MKPVTVKAVLETLEIAKNGYYVLDNKRIDLPCTPSQMRQAEVNPAKHTSTLATEFLQLEK